MSIHFRKDINLMQLLVRICFTPAAGNAAGCFQMRMPGWFSVTRTTRVPSAGRMQHCIEVPVARMPRNGCGCRTRRNCDAGCGMRLVQTVEGLLMMLRPSSVKCGGRTVRMHRRFSGRFYGAG